MTSPKLTNANEIIKDYLIGTKSVLEDRAKFILSVDARKGLEAILLEAIHEKLTYEVGNPVVNEADTYMQLQQLDYQIAFCKYLINVSESNANALNSKHS